MRRLFNNKTKTLLLGFSLILAGCASNDMVYESEYSSMLGSSYQKLENDPEHVGSRYWIENANTVKQYTKIMIEPMAIHTSPVNHYRVPQHMKEGARYYFEKSLEDAFSRDYEIVDEAGPGVLVVRASITGIRLDKPDVRLYDIIPVAFVINATKEMTGTRKRIVTVNMEAEAFDSLSHERIAMVVQKSRLETNTQTHEELGVVIITQALEGWVQKATNRFDAIHSATVTAQVL